MPLWRTKALDLIRANGKNPDTHEFRYLRAADTPMRLWIELKQVFDRAYEEKPPNMSLIRGVYQYALWCVNQAARGTNAALDCSTAAVVCFFEELPDSPAAARMHEFVPRETFERLIPALKYGRTDQEHAKLVAEMREKYRVGSVSRRKT